MTQQRHDAAHAAALGMSGGLAGGIAKTCVAPLERIKLLMQTGQSTGLIITLRRILHHEGYLALWRGNTVNVIRMVPNKCVLLSCSDIYKDVLRSCGGGNLSTFLQGGVAGALAGCTATFATYPLDLARTRMAGVLHKATGPKLGSSAGFVATLLTIRRQEGFGALFRGVTPTVLGALPYEGLKFGTYDWLKRETTSPGEKTSPIWRACCGAIAALVAHVATYPNDVIRRRLQLQGSTRGELLYCSYWDCCRQLVRNEGWLVLYRGLGVTMVRAVPNTGIQFGVYEGCKDLIERYR
jgi:hypothetical protein